MTKQFHVYIDEDGKYQVVDTTGCNTRTECEAKLPPHISWYGTFAESPEGAIAKAKAANLTYVPPIQMHKLETELGMMQALTEPYTRSKGEASLFWTEDARELLAELIEGEK